jgi:hypothetical protein
MKMRMLAVSACAAALIALPTNHAAAQKAVTAYAGATDVTLSNNFVSELKALGVNVGQVNPTMLSGMATFPITGGVIDLDTAMGNIVHSGGLTFSGGTTTVRLQSFIIDTTGKKPVITGIVVVDNKVWGRFPLFDLVLPPGTAIPLKNKGNTLALANVGVMLDATAAGALNKAYGVSQFTAGFDVGTAQVTAYVSSNDWTY